MIPWFDLRIPSLGPITVHPFGILVAVGIMVGANATLRRGRALGLPKESLQSMITTILVGGFVVAHLFDLVAYQAATGMMRWSDVLNPTSGLSSFGGFAGAVGALLWWARRRGEPVAPYADSLAFGLAPGWLFGRLGCFTAHDHPGRLTHFFLGVQYPEGARHDLGLDEALFAAAITLLFWALGRRPRRVGTYTTILALTYGPIRFGLDFLRATDLSGADPRYFGLTPAQFGCVILWIVGIVLATTMLRARTSWPAATEVRATIGPTRERQENSAPC